jgi:hypothetical protein
MHKESGAHLGTPGLLSEPGMEDQCLQRMVSLHLPVLSSPEKANPYMGNKTKLLLDPTLMAPTLGWYHWGLFGVGHLRPTL